MFSAIYLCLCTYKFLLLVPCLFSYLIVDFEYKVQIQLHDEKINNGNMQVRSLFTSPVSFTARLSKLALKFSNQKCPNQQPKRNIHEVKKLEQTQS